MFGRWCCGLSCYYCCHCAGCSCHTQMPLSRTHWHALLKLLKIADARRWTYSSLPHCAFWQAAWKCWVIWLQQPEQGWTVQQITDCWKSGVKKNKKTKPSLLLPASTNPLWKEAVINGILIIIMYNGAKLRNTAHYNIYIRLHCFVYISFDCNHRCGAQFHNSTGCESVWMSMLFRSQAGLCSEILWNRSSRGHLRQGNWADREAGLQ